MPDSSQFVKFLDEENQANCFCGKMCFTEHYLFLFIYFNILHGFLDGL